LSYLENAWLEGLCSTPDRPNGVYRIRFDPRAFFNPLSWISKPLATVRESVSDAVFLAADLEDRLRYNFSSASTAGFATRLLSLPAATPFFDMSPLQSRLRKYIDLEKIRNSERALIVNTTDWNRGMARIFTNHEMTDPQGYDVLQASAAYLLVFPFVAIKGGTFGGGPGSLSTPLRPVVDMWAPRAKRLTVHTIYLDPRLAEVPLEKIPSMFGGLGRYFSLNLSINIRADVEYGVGKLPPVLQEAAGPKGAVTIHRYRPSKVILDWFAETNFDRLTTKGYIELGYRDARNHNCRAAGCVLAE
jgi:hypothetical protein